MSDDSYPRLPHFEAPETPGPVRARVNNLQGQISDLIRREQTAARKHKSEVCTLEQTVATQKTELAATNTSLASVRATLEATQKELARCQSEGNGMKDELNLHSVVNQQKALLVLAQEQLQVVELERRLVQAETARVMRDHKIALFQAKEEDLLAELAERDSQIDELTASLDQAASSSTSQKSSSEKLLRQQLDRANAEKESLEAKVEKLESNVRGLKEREKEARAELDGWLREEKGKESGSDKEKRDLQVQLKSTRKELDKKSQELEDAQEELQGLKESSREREKSLKAKLKAAQAVSAAASEDDAPAPSRQASKRPSPKKVERKARKASTPPPSEEESPKKKAKATGATSGKRVEPLIESTQNRAKEKEKAVPPTKPKVVVEDVDEDSAGPKKKKRTLLGKTQPNFNWDSIMNGVAVQLDAEQQSGDGMIPSMLSPMKPPGAASTGTIPRAGFVGFPSSKSLARF